MPRFHGLTALLLVVVAGALTAPAAQAAPPIACFTQSPANPTPGQTITFDSSCSRDQDASGRITGRAWDTKNDGTYNDHINTVVITHTYPAPGTYTMKLAVVDNSDVVDTEIKTVTVNAPPSASFSFTPEAPVVGDQVTLTSTAGDADGSIAETAWDLDGDSEFDDATGSSTTTSFATPGPHAVGLRVTDNRGASTTATGTIEVGDRPPDPGPGTPGQPFDTSAPVGAEPPIVAPVEPLRWLDPFPTVRIRGRTTSSGVRFSLFSVRAPAGSSVKLRCVGRGCPKKSISTRVKARKGAATGTRRIKSFERQLQAGIVVKVYVTRRGLVGKYTSFKIRRLALPVRRDRCLMPNSTRPVTCPAAP